MMNAKHQSRAMKAQQKKQPWMACLLCLAILFRLTLAAQAQSLPSTPAESREVSGTLYPGDSYTFRNVTMIWKANAADKNTSEPLGFLVIKGPDAMLAHVPLYPSKMISNLFKGNNHPFKYNFMAYLDDVRVLISYVGHFPNGGKLVLDKGINYDLAYFPSRMTVDAAPHRNRELLISQQTPLRINEWQFSISAKPATYPDGSQYYQLIGHDSVHNEDIIIPAKSSSGRRFGRFTINVGKFYEETLSAQLAVSSTADRTIQGGETYVENLDVNSDGGLTYEEFLSKLAKNYKFEIDWAEFPAGHPESIDYLKKKQIRQMSNLGGGLLKDCLDQLAVNLMKYYRINEEAAFEWKDAYHVRIWAKNYDKIVAEKETQAKALAMKKTVEEAKAAELKLFTEKFKKDYTGQVQIYKLNRITPVTAKALVEPELRDYYLIEWETLGPSFESRVKEKGKYYWIIDDDHANPLPEDVKKGVIRASYGRDRQFKEQVIPDDKANALIVTAIPKTQERIKEILSKMDGMLAEKPEAAAPLKQYRIEVILLQGYKGEEKKAKGITFPWQPQDRVIKCNGKEYIIREWQQSGNYGYDITYMEIDGATTPSQVAQPPNIMKREYIIDTVAPITVLGERRKHPFDSTSDMKGLFVRYSPRQSALADVNLKPAKDYGLSPEDIKLMGFDTVKELGRGLVTLTGDRGEAGKAQVQLSEAYRCELQFQDLRPPYVIVKGALYIVLTSAAQAELTQKPLLGNTLFLEKDKPTLLGLTNLREALILLIKLHD